MQVELSGIEAETERPAPIAHLSYNANVVILHSGDVIIAIARPDPSIVQASLAKGRTGPGMGTDTAMTEQ